MSTITAVLDALETLSNTTLPNSQTVNGPIASVTVTKPRLVIIGDEEILFTRDLDSMAIGTSSEEYDVPVVVSAALSGADQGAADDAAMADYAALELAIREYSGGPNLGLSASGVQLVLPRTQGTLRRVATESGRAAEVRFMVHVRAQNT